MLQSKNTSLIEENGQLQDLCANKDLIVQNLEQERDSFKDHIKAYEARLSLLIESEHLVKMIQETQTHSSEVKDRVYEELEMITDFMAEQSGHMVDTATVNTRLKDTVRSLESENLILRDMVTDLKRRVTVYVPVKDDPIDMAIADF